MAMLAEPRQRKRYNLVPKGLPLYEDEKRFGTKMLEKMGWKKGSGLGANEGGSKDFVRIRYKNDNLGLGFEQRDDQWTQHEKSFAGLLETLNSKNVISDLNGGKENSNDDDIRPRVGFSLQEAHVIGKAKPKIEKLKEKISGVSLEEKSKQSKARVHYKKFTKGKDLAQYSEKDLANIFGKKTCEQASSDFFQCLNNTFIQNKETSEGVQMINTGVSVSDYFKAKIKAPKDRRKGFDITESSMDNNLDSNEVQTNENVTKKMENISNKSDVCEYEIEKGREGCSKALITCNISANDDFKMNVDVMGNEKNDLNTEEGNRNSEIYCNVAKKGTANKKKKKNKKELKKLENNIILDPAKKKMSKSKRNAIIGKEEKFEQINEVETLELPLNETKNKKQEKSINRAQDLLSEHISTKKRKLNNSEAKIEEPYFLIDLPQEPTKRKKKKNKSMEAKVTINLESGNEDIADNYDYNPSIEKKTKSKKSKDSFESSVNEDNLSNLREPDEIVSHFPKDRRKDVGSNAKNLFTSNCNLEILDIEEIKNKYEAFNIYPISSFCAEKFRNVSLNDFKGSILPQIEGYGLGPDLQLNVQINSTDEERITNLWKGVLDKYTQCGIPKKPYSQYVREVFKARKAKQKMPKLCVKTWKRKNAFQII